MGAKTLMEKNVFCQFGRTATPRGWGEPLFFCLRRAAIGP